jgi:hypothetical protein
MYDHAASDDISTVRDHDVRSNHRRTNALQSCMQEALIRFDAVCDTPWFAKTSVLLILEDTDILVEKLQRAPPVDYVPAYSGGESHDVACDYLLRRFMSLIQSPEMR